MSILTDRLNYYIDKRKERVSELARRCGMDRATLHQYLSDRRPLKNRAHLEALMTELHLTPNERTDVEEAFEIYVVGERTYHRRRKMEEILSSLPFIENEQEATPTARDIQLLKDNEIPGILVGELEINRFLNRLFQDATKREKDIFLLTQPDDNALTESLILLRRFSKTARVVHLICMESDCGPDGCRNLTLLQEALRCSISIRNYEPRYFYGKETEHYGIMNLLPHLVLTDRLAVQRSADRKTALIHRNAEVIGYFMETFQTISRRSRPLMLGLDFLSQQPVQWGLTNMKQLLKSYHIEMCFGLCSVHYWDREMVHKYINPALPGSEVLAEQYADYFPAVLEAKKKYQTSLLTNAFGVEEFIRTGIIREYPPIFFCKPVEPEDRKILVGKVIQAIHEGWYHLHIAPQDKFPLTYRWELCAYQTNNFLLQYSSVDQFLVFQIDEPDILNAAWDYVTNLLSHPDILSEEQSAAFLRDLADRYLP